MARIAYTVFPTHPRTVWRAGDVATFVTRSNNAAGWKSYYDNRILVSAADIYNNYATSAIASDNIEVHNKTLNLILCGEVESSALYRNKAIEVGLYIAGNLSAYDNRRTRLLAAIWVYDLLYNYLTSGQRSTIRTWLKLALTDMQARITDTAKITSHSGANAMCCLAGGVAIQTEDAAGDGYIVAALNHWYGSTPGDGARMEYDRYFCSDGGSERGTEYHFTEQYIAHFVLHYIDQGFVRNADTPGSLLLDGLEYEPWTDENSWVTAAPEWWLRNGMDGRKEYEVLGDTDRVTSPWVNEYEHNSFAFWISRGGTQWRKNLRWMYDQKLAKETPVAYYQVMPFVLFDMADADKASEAPQVTTPAINRSRFFNPPQHYTYVHPNWDIASSCQLTMPYWRWWIDNHMHLDAGALYINVRGDPVFFNTGVYNTSDPKGLYAAWHHRYWYQQSIAAPGVPMIRGQASDASNVSYNYYIPVGGDYTRTAIPHAGGQAYIAVGGISGDYAPNDTASMLTDGGGLMWLKCTATCSINTDYDFICADLRRAYLKEYTEYGTATERVRKCNQRRAVLKSVAPWPVIFQVEEIESRVASFGKYDHWHGHSQPVFDIPNARFYCRGYHGIGKVYVHYHNATQLSFVTVGGGTPDSAGYGSQDFRFDGVSYAPSIGPDWRRAPFCGHYRVEVAPVSGQTTDHLVSLILPMLLAEAPPAYTFFEEANWFGVDFSGTQVRIHKTSDQIQYGDLDTEPPAVPQVVVATSGPASGQVTVSCSPNSDDTAQYIVEYREKT